MKAIFNRLIDVLRDGLSLFWIAPLIPALVLVPEFLQHIAEIRIGMFESKDTFIALANDPQRMVWGYLKIAGLLLALLAATRFWGAQERGQNWWDLRGMAWRNFGIAFGLMIVTVIPGTLLEAQIGPDMAGILNLAITLATLPLVALLVAGLIGDSGTGLKTVFRTGWLASLRILIFAAAVWAPLQWLHGQTHEWAMGQSAAIVWALMAFDALVVGALAMLAGTAFHHGYSLNKQKESAA